LSRFGTFTINGSDYDLDDLTLDEMEEIEENAGGIPYSELNFGSAKTMKAIAFTLMRRKDSTLEMEQIGKIKLLDFAPADEEMPAGPPVEGAETETVDPNGSAPADAGARLSAVSTGG
jgi:hypothetical protein